MNCVEKYKEANDGRWPSNIVIFRDGMGSGKAVEANAEAIKVADAVEAAFTADANADKEAGKGPKVTVLLVRTRHNTKFVEASGAGCANPPAGTILDHTVTERNWYDFYLIPMNVSQGTVTPTHFTVVHDDSSFTPDTMQK